MAHPAPYFECSRVNDTTFVIVENDKYDEHPFIYLKTYDDPPLLVLSDTGCGGRESGTEEFSGNLKLFIETTPISSNCGKPLNPRAADGKPPKDYLIICTHCHFDHILGLKHFANSFPAILASSYGRDFVEHDLPEHSLCKSMDIVVPRYRITHWADHLEFVRFNEVNLGLQILQTPGHTPDELAWYDIGERHLYVGDTFYDRVATDKSYEQAIFFPKEGHLTEYMQSLDVLLHFVEEQNAKSPEMSRVKVGCGHVTASTDAEEVIAKVRTLFRNIICGKIPEVKREVMAGEAFVTFQEDERARFAVALPMRLVEDARKLGGLT